MNKKEAIIVSACLLGINCTYKATNNRHDAVLKLRAKYQLIPICPEVLGGLTTPRIPAEVTLNGVFNKEGSNVTSYFIKGAQKAYNIAKEHEAKIAILKERSPSCGVDCIYDGTFSGKQIKGMGVTTKLLKEHNIKVYSENNFEDDLL